jgi:hypothetical protein
MFLLLAHVLEREGEPVAHLIADNAADANPARFGQAFEPCRDVDPVAVDIAPVLDDVAEIDPHAEFDAAIRRHTGVSLGHRALHFDCAAHRVDDARKLDQQPVAGGLDDAATVLLDLGITQLTTQRFEAFERAFLVCPHQPRIRGHIGGKDRSETAGLAHVVSSAARRRPSR